jgi:hypothetical protein
MLSLWRQAILHFVALLETGRQRLHKSAFLDQVQAAKSTSAIPIHRLPSELPELCTQCFFLLNCDSCLRREYLSLPYTFAGKAWLLR